MTNDQQKKLLEEIKNELAFSLNRMNQIVELLDVIVEDNTAEKEAKLRFIEEILKSQKKIGSGGARGKGGKGGDIGGYNGADGEDGKDTK
jgi:hypothetical protein